MRSNIQFDVFDKHPYFSIRALPTLILPCSLQNPKPLTLTPDCDTTSIWQLAISKAQACLDLEFFMLC